MQEFAPGDENGGLRFTAQGSDQRISSSETARKPVGQNKDNVATKKKLHESSNASDGGPNNKKNIVKMKRIYVPRDSLLTYVCVCI